MSARFVNIDRDTPLLLPPDLREWVPEDDPVHFVLEVVMSMKLSTLKVNRRGTGSEQYPPKAMLALLIYCYANGIFSSRRIERATHRDVAVRYLMADTHPDHDTICTFRRENLDALQESFVEVLRLAKQMGVLKVGTISVDGTKVHASASKDRNVRYDRAGELDEQLTAEIDQLLVKAEQADRQDQDDDTAGGQKLPEQIGRLSALREKMREARRQIEQDAAAQAEKQRPEYEKKLAAYAERRGRGCKPKPPDDTPKADQQTNLTDPDSRLMRKSNRSSYEQSYNAQAAVDADGSMLILAQHVTPCASDAHELIPLVDAVTGHLESPTAVLADTGYCKIETIEQLESQVDLYVAVNRQDNHEQRRHDYRPREAQSKPGKAPTNPHLLRMQEKLRTDEGRRQYRKRKQSVEPVFGIIKSVMGFRRFMLRGIEKVSGEWSLVSLAYNIKRLFNLRPAA